MTTKPIFSQGFKTCIAANTIEDLSDNPKLTFTKLWLYPAKSKDNSGKLVANVGNIYIGKRGAGDVVTPDLMDNAAGATLIQLEPHQTLRLCDVIIQADNAEDGVFFSYT